MTPRPEKPPEEHAQGRPPAGGVFSRGASCPLPRRTPECFRAAAATARNLRRAGRLKRKLQQERASPCSLQEHLHGACRRLREKRSPHGKDAGSVPAPPETPPPPLLPAEGGAFRRFSPASAPSRPPPLRQKTGCSDRGRQPFNIVFSYAFFAFVFSLPFPARIRPFLWKNSLTKNTFKDI